MKTSSARWEGDVERESRDSRPRRRHGKKQRCKADPQGRPRYEFRPHFSNARELSACFSVPLAGRKRGQGSHEGAAVAAPAAATPAAATPATQARRQTCQGRESRRGSRQKSRGSSGRPEKSDGQPMGTPPSPANKKPASPPSRSAQRNRPRSPTPKNSRSPRRRGQGPLQFQRPALAGGAGMAGRHLQHEPRLAGVARRLPQSHHAAVLHRGGGPRLDQSPPVRPRLHHAAERRSASRS